MGAGPAALVLKNGIDSVTVDMICEASDAELVVSRMKMISQIPSLMQKELERLSVIHQDVGEILYLRLRRHAQPGETDTGIREQSTLLAHLIPGILRYNLEQVRTDDSTSDPDHQRLLLESVLRKLLAHEHSAGH